jgi:fructoselysine and glucoselysine-specific PTS system IIA component
MSLTDKSEHTRKFLIATHGDFSAGVKSSLDMIIGEMDNVFIIRAYTEENKPLEEEIKAVLALLNETDELVVFCDIMGGSVTNQIIIHASVPHVHVIAGFNLPLLIEVLLAGTDTPIAGIISESIDNAKEQMVYVNKLLITQQA